jgi:phosphopantothenate synthetase
MQTKTFKELENEAARDAAALKFRGASLPALYVPGTTATLTKEQAVARALEADPEVYARYRAEHNARALVNTLKAAGVQIVQR